MIAGARSWASSNLRKAARRCWERMPANGQKRPPRGWSCRSSNRPREIDHLALLLPAPSSSAYYHPARFPPSFPPFHPLSLAPPDSTIHPRARCIIVRPHRLAHTSSTCPEQASARAHTRTRTEARMIVACASGNERALSPQHCTASVCDVIKPPALIPFLPCSLHSWEATTLTRSRRISPRSSLPRSPPSSYSLSPRRSLAAARRQLPAANMAAAN